MDIRLGFECDLSAWLCYWKNFAVALWFSNSWVYWFSSTQNDRFISDVSLLGECEDVEEKSFLVPYGVTLQILFPYHDKLKCLLYLPTNLHCQAFLQWPKLPTTAHNSVGLKANTKKNCFKPSDNAPCHIYASLLFGSRQFTLHLLQFSSTATAESLNLIIKSTRDLSKIYCEH